MLSYGRGASAASLTRCVSIVEWFARGDTGCRLGDGLLARYYRAQLCGALVVRVAAGFVHENGPRTS